MAHGPDIQARVRAAYVHDRMTLEQAAERHDVSVGTARRWKSAAEAAGDDWERARSAARLAGDGMQLVAQMILNDYLLLHQATIDGIREAADIPPLNKAEALSRLADAFTKTMSAVGKAAPELSKLAVATDVLQRLAKYVAGNRPDLAAALLEVIEPFAAELAKDYG